MPISAPVAASGSRTSTKRQHHIPQSVKAACLLMIEEAVDFVTAAKACDLKPDTMRRWLHRPEVISFLRRERAAFREAICSANDRVLAQIRDKTDGNAMARVHAVRALEGMAEEASIRPTNAQPGVTIRVVTIVQQGAPGAPPSTIDVTPPRQALPHQRVPLASERQYPVFRGGPSDEDEIGPVR
jgi:hypothetical protein